MRLPTMPGSALYYYCHTASFMTSTLGVKQNQSSMAFLLLPLFWHSSILVLLFIAHFTQLSHYVYDDQEIIRTEMKENDFASHAWLLLK